MTATFAPDPQLADRPGPSTDPSVLMANAIRALSMDAVQQANSGHPGAPMQDGEHSGRRVQVQGTAVTNHRACTRWDQVVADQFLDAEPVDLGQPVEPGGQRLTLARWWVQGPPTAQAGAALCRCQLSPGDSVGHAR